MRMTIVTMSAAALALTACGGGGGDAQTIAKMTDLCAAQGETRENCECSIKVAKDNLSKESWALMEKMANAVKSEETAQSDIMAIMGDLDMNQMMKMGQEAMAMTPKVEEACGFTPEGGM